MALVTKSFSDIITFTRASTGTFFNSAGVLTSAGNNVPRLDYNPATLAARGLLVEEQRTNLLLQSEDFATTWTALNVTPSTNTALSPAGTLTADTLTPAASTAAHLISQSVTVTASTAYSASVFIKTDGAPFVQIAYDNGASVGAFMNVNLSTGAITRGPELAGGAINATGSVVAVANGYYRISVGATHTGTTGRVLISPLTAGQSAAGLNPSTTTTATDNVIVWGAQLEAGAFPTSYIPTTTTALTRSADVASVNTLSPWWNSATGTFYAENQQLPGQTATVFPRMMSANDGTTSNAIDMLWRSDTSRMYMAVTAASSVVADVGTNSVTQTNINKIAGAFATNDFAASVNGGAASTDTSGALPTGINILRIGSGPGGASGFINGYLRRIAYYPRRLTDAQLQTLTT